MKFLTINAETHTKDKMAPKRVYFETAQICIAPASGFIKFEKEHVVKDAKLVDMQCLIPIQTCYCSCGPRPGDCGKDCPNYGKY